MNESLQVQFPPSLPVGRTPSAWVGLSDSWLKVNIVAMSMAMVIRVVRFMGGSVGTTLIMERIKRIFAGNGGCGKIRLIRSIISVVLFNVF